MRSSKTIDTPKRRIIACIDGTWYLADDDDDGNRSNVFRVHNAIRQGVFRGEDNEQTEQIVRYFPGTDDRGRPIDDFDDDVTASGSEDQIRQVCQFFKEEIQSENDDIWLFGFSRGAYIARAVANLLHGEELPEKGKKPGKIRSALSWPRTKTTEVDPTSVESRRRDWLPGVKRPKKQFLGLFDSVKKCSSKTNFETGYCSSIQQIWHALALNETRSALSPLHYDLNSISQMKYSQAWFLGGHADLGGGGPTDGLSLYPLQWMLLECRKQGLVLDKPSSTMYPSHGADPNGTRLNQNVTGLIMPPPSALELQASAVPWDFKFANKRRTVMYDLRVTHNHQDMHSLKEERDGKKQRRKLHKRAPEGHAGPHTHQVIMYQRPPRWFSVNKQREIFIGNTKTAGNLIGYDDSSTNGSFIHPSVYFLLDTYGISFGLHKIVSEGLNVHLQAFRKAKRLSHTANGKIIPLYPWLLGSTFMEKSNCRILICGNTGVGKSTLLNRVFGMPITQEVSMASGKHDIDRPIESDKHPGVIIHDSEGFQAGASEEVEAFNKFVQHRCSLDQIDVNECLHAIWLCVESYSKRPVQPALGNVLREIHKVKSSIPIIVVGTKLDEYKAIQSSLSNGKDLDIVAEQKKNFQTAFRTSEHTKQVWGNLDTKVTFVSKDDAESVKRLLQLTLTSVDDMAAKGLTGAQVVDPDTKIKMAVHETLKMVKAVSATATAGLGSGIGAMAGTVTLSKSLCKTIAGGCYGLPDDVWNEISGTLNEVVWGRMRKFVTGKVIQATVWSGSVMVSIATLGVTAPLVGLAATKEGPSAARIFIKVAIDLILVLDCAFMDNVDMRNMVADEAIKERVRRICERYEKEKVKAGKKKRTRKAAVHADVNKAFPLLTKDMFLQYFFSNEKEGGKNSQAIMDIIHRHRMKDGDSKARSRVSESSDGSSAAKDDEDADDMDEVDGLEDIEDDE